MIHLKIYIFFLISKRCRCFNVYNVSKSYVYFFFKLLNKNCDTIRPGFLLTILIFYKYEK